MDLVVRTERLSKRFGKHVALADVDLEIRRGEVFGYIGPNGAGKTTTIRTLLGLLRPSGGTASVFGFDAWGQSSQVHERTGYLPAEASLYPNMSGQNHVDYISALRGSGASGRDHAREVSQRLDLDLIRPARVLSRGNRQKLALVLALMTRPELLVLDEPTNGLDPLVQQQFHELLAEHTATGGTVLLSSHVLSEVQRVADRVGIIRLGRLVAVEGLEELRAKSMHQVEIAFAQPPPVEPFQRIEGVRDPEIRNAVLTCSATQDSLDPLMKEAARHQIVDLSCQEADLEAMFLAFYGKERGNA